MSEPESDPSETEPERDPSKMDDVERAAWRAEQARGAEQDFADNDIVGTFVDEDDND